MLHLICCINKLLHELEFRNFFSLKNRCKKHQNIKKWFSRELDEQNRAQNQIQRHQVIQLRREMSVSDWGSPRGWNGKASCGRRRTRDGPQLQERYAASNQKDSSDGWGRPTIPEQEAIRSHKEDRSDRCVKDRQQLSEMKRRDTGHWEAIV